MASVAVSAAAQRHSPQRFPNISGSDCVSMTSANTYSVPADTFRQYINDGANSMRWQLWGDIEFTDGTMSRRVTSAADFSVSVRSKVGKYGKGRIQFYCGDDDERWPCNPSTVLDVYKSFRPDTSFTIAGVGCFKAGDTLVYSVDPILTTNINSCIGFDNYSWQYPQDLFEILYTSGDSSSYTVRAMREARLSDEMFVWFGRKNKGDRAKALQLPLRAKAPMPTVNGGLKNGSTLCMAAERNIKFSVDQPDTSKYSYVWKASGSLSVTCVDKDTSSVICGGSGTLYLNVLDKKSDSECSTTTMMINLRPSLDGYAINAPDMGLEAAPRVEIRDFPGGDALVWSSDDARLETNNINATLYPYPGKSKVTVVADMPVCKSMSGVTSSISGTFYLPPRKVTVGAYTNDGVASDCYNVGDTVLFKAVVSSGEPQVDGTVYVWQHLPGWTYLRESGGEALVIVGASPSLVQQVSYSNPKSYCKEARVASRQIAFYAAAPTITTPDLCMNVNLVNDVTLSVEQQPGINSYSWTYSTDSGGQQGVATTAGTLDLTFNGVPGIYGYTVAPVSQISGDGCGGGSASSAASIVIPSLPSGVEIVTTLANRGTKKVFRYYVDGVQRTPEAWLEFDANEGYTVVYGKTLSVFIWDYDDATEEDIPLSGKVGCLFKFTADGCEHYALLSKAFSGDELYDASVQGVSVEDILGSSNKVMTLSGDGLGADPAEYTTGLAPNPATDVVAVSVDPLYDVELAVVSVGGGQVLRLVRPAGSSSVEVSVADIPAGLYVVVVRQNGDAKSYRLVVKH